MIKMATKWCKGISVNILAKSTSMSKNGSDVERLCSQPFLLKDERKPKQAKVHVNLRCYTITTYGMNHGFFRVIVTQYADRLVNSVWNSPSPQVFVNPISDEPT